MQLKVKSKVFWQMFLGFAVGVFVFGGFAEAQVKRAKNGKTKQTKQVNKMTSDKIEYQPDADLLKEIQTQITVVESKKDWCGLIVKTRRQIKAELARHILKHINQIFIVAALFLICAANIEAQAKSDKAFSTMRKEHAEALKNWLKPNLRPATEADCQNKAGLKLQRAGEGASNYQPYYLASDLSGDKKTDFAVVLIDTRKRNGSNFVLVIFNRAANGFQQAHYQTNLDLRQSGLFSWGGHSEYLAVGEFQTDDCGFFKWTGKKYVAEDCEAGGN